MTSKKIAFASLALATMAFAPLTAAKADMPAVPADAEQCMTMVENVIAEQRKAPSNPAMEEKFDKVVGMAMQNCDKKDFEAAQKSAVEAAALLKK